MARTDMMSTDIESRLGVRDSDARLVRWPSWLGVIAGIWLIVAPFALDYATTRATVNSIIVGVLALIVSAISAMTYSTIPNWVHAVVAIWLIVAPWALDYEGAGEVVSASNSDFATGAALFTLHFTIGMSKVAVNRLRMSRRDLEGRGVGPEKDLMAA